MAQLCYTTMLKHNCPPSDAGPYSHCSLHIKAWAFSLVLLLLLVIPLSLWENMIASLLTLWLLVQIKHSHICGFMTRRRRIRYQPLSFHSCHVKAQSTLPTVPVSSKSAEALYREFTPVELNFVRQVCLGMIWAAQWECALSHFDSSMF